MISDKLVQEYKNIYKKKYGQDISDSEARDQAQRLASLVEILHNQAVTEHRRELRLKKEGISGFYLESSDGIYTCGICGDSYQGNDIWWNKKGIRCRDCWSNIKKKVIPSLTYDIDNKVWIKEWQLRHDYNIHPATRSKLWRQRLLHGRDLKREDGSVYCTVYLVKENQEILKKYPKQNPDIKVIVKDSKGDEK